MFGLIHYVCESADYNLILAHRNAKSSYFLKEDLELHPTHYQKINVLKSNKLYKLFSIIFPLTTGASSNVPLILAESL